MDSFKHAVKWAAYKFTSTVLDGVRSLRVHVDRPRDQQHQSYGAWNRSVFGGLFQDEQFLRAMVGRYRIGSAFLTLGQLIIGTRAQYLVNDYYKQSPAGHDYLAPSAQYTAAILTA
ncbi:hypothetical protein P7C73_g17, partial [Tremellales sp. Uapishka_1]